MKLEQVVTRFLLSIFSIGLIVSPIDQAFAKSKKKTGAIPVSPGQYFPAKVKIKLPGAKKAKGYSVQCYKGAAGKVNNSKFTSYANLSKKAKGVKQALYKALSKAGAKACKPANNPNSPDSPKYPDFLSLKTYDGPFGIEQASRLFDVFGFGATFEQKQEAVAQGLNKTIAQLTTFIPEPGIEAYVADVECDGKIAGKDSNNETCDALDPNDFYMEGVVYGQYYRFIKSQNQFFEKLFFFLSDERLATSTSALNWCDAYAIRDYIKDVRAAAINGDYKQYMYRMNNSLLVHLRWLDGDSNSGFGPNENYAREFWELGTVGPTDLAGKKVYSDLDIANAALAFSGWTVNDQTINGHTVCFGAFSEYLHAKGPKVIFAGTPHQAVVYDANDVLEATFAHPRSAEHLAEDIWKQFINPYATATDIIELAKIIRENNYNLIPVMKKIMASKAFYADESRKSLIKHPIDLIVGFIRATQFPVSNWDVYNIISNQLLQRILGAPTVFGWDEKDLAAEARILESRNAINFFTTKSSESYVKAGYNIRTALLSGLPIPGKSDAEAVVERISALLGVSLTASEKTRLMEYMNYNLYPCSWNQNKCKNGQSYLGQGKYYLVNEPYSVDPLFEDMEYKLRGVLNIIGQLPSYRTK